MTDEHSDILKYSVADIRERMRQAKETDDDNDMDPLEYIARQLEIHRLAINEMADTLNDTVDRLDALDNLINTVVYMTNGYIHDRDDGGGEEIVFVPEGEDNG